MNLLDESLDDQTLICHVLEEALNALKDDEAAAATRLVRVAIAWVACLPSPA